MAVQDKELRKNDIYKSFAKAYLVLTKGEYELLKKRILAKNEEIKRLTILLKRGGGNLISRRAHNPEIAGLNPAPAIQGVILNV